MPTHDNPDGPCACGAWHNSRPTMDMAALARCSARWTSPATADIATISPYNSTLSLERPFPTTGNVIVRMEVVGLPAAVSVKLADLRRALDEVAA